MNDIAKTQQEFRRLWDELAPIGRADSGGYLRYSWTEADAACREWFHDQATARGLSTETDRNGNLYAWWGDPDRGDAVLTGSHFDSVPHGGAYDGPLGIVSAFLAIDILKTRNIQPHRPIAIAAFTEEEGGRFGVPCLGSRLMTGAYDPNSARALTDRDGTTLEEAMRAAGEDPDALGVDTERLNRFGCFIELHVEQGRALVHDDAPVGVASAIWPHGRWRFGFSGEGNHAGTTPLADRRDPMLTFAFTTLAARKEAKLAGALATIGRVSVDPGATNAIAAHVDAWLDARAPDEETLNQLVAEIEQKARERSTRDGTSVDMVAESVTRVVEFDDGLRDRIAALLGGVPVLPTGAGHDAGVLAGHIPTAMLFVRNPTGVSHSPSEFASDDDCAQGVHALATVLRELAWLPTGLSGRGWRTGRPLRWRSRLRPDTSALWRQDRNPKERWSYPV
nr:allantoate amidohydrolase [Natronoglycomyces albus]